jgi:hypothetical protein
MSDVYWNSAIESLIKGIGEKSLSLRWLHSKSEKRYSYLNNCLAIPSIILSTITATIGGTFAGDKTFSYITAVISIIVSVLTTLNSYFIFAKRAESHRITSISYSKLFLQINIELSLPRTKRMMVKQFLKSVSEQIMRLNEIEPSVPDAVIAAYNIKFNNEPDTISKPECTNGLAEIKIYLEQEPITIESPVETFPLNPSPEPTVEKKKKPVFH